MILREAGAALSAKRLSHGLDDAGLKSWFIFKTFIAALETTHAQLNRYQDSFPGIKRRGYEINHSPQPVPRLRMSGAVLTPPPLRGVGRENFAVKINENVLRSCRSPTNYFSTRSTPKKFIWNVNSCHLCTPMAQKTFSTCWKSFVHKIFGEGCNLLYVANQMSQ